MIAVDGTVNSTKTFSCDVTCHFSFQSISIPGEVNMLKTPPFQLHSRRIRRIRAFYLREPNKQAADEFVYILIYYVYVPSLALFY